jgi:hypothetical protein
MQMWATARPRTLGRALQMLACSLTFMLLVAVRSRSSPLTLAQSLPMSTDALVTTQGCKWPWLLTITDVYDLINSQKGSGDKRNLLSDNLQKTTLESSRE